MQVPPMSNFHPFGKLLIFMGILLIVVGVLFLCRDKIPFIGKLPGDISIKRDNFNFYFPLTTCILISLILSLLLYLLGKFKG
jgi:hypothetical protein